jgi:hypothetical protein
MEMKMPGKEALPRKSLSIPSSAHSEEKPSAVS